MYLYVRRIDFASFTIFILDFDLDVDATKCQKIVPYIVQREKSDETKEAIRRRKSKDRQCTTTAVCSCHDIDDKVADMVLNNNHSLNDYILLLC